MAADLMTKLAGLKPGDYITATGQDTRGHAVTRVGFLLWEPKEVKAQRNGTSTKAWRVFVGTKGMEPSDRSSWVTMFADSGSVEVVTTDPEGVEWKDTELRNAVSSAVILYGGKGGKNTSGPRQARKVSIGYTESGAYALTDLETNELVDTMRLQSRIWWAAMPADHYENQARPKQLGRKVNEHQDQDETPAPDWQKRKMMDFVNWGDEPVYFWFAGPAKRKPLTEGRMVRVRWAESRNGENRLVDVHTNEVVDVIHSASKVWAVPATDEEIANMPPLVELENGRPDYSLPPEEREEPSWVEDDEPAPQPRKPIRSGVLFEGWLGEKDDTGGYKVWDNARRRVIGWLSADHTMFRPVGA
ncbi:hypothetical protein AB0F36_07940 [Streptomyces sp. NPDC029080]|uniref:hypothetical protein n=1 Tax=Streptomyces sp. NPDC029080 TaxID=3155017 RepID=UPI0033FD4571